MRPKNKLEDQWESMQDGCNTTNGVRCRDMGSEESTRKEVGYGGNEDVEMDEWMESRLKWYGQVSGREEECVGKIMMVVEVPGNRTRGRPKRMWLDIFKNDLLERVLSGEEARKTELIEGVS